MSALFYTRLLCSVWKECFTSSSEREQEKIRKRYAIVARAAAQAAIQRYYRLYYVRPPRPLTEEDLEWWAEEAGSAGFSKRWSYSGCSKYEPNEPYVIAENNVLPCKTCDVNYMFIHKDHPVVQWCKWWMHVDNIDGFGMYAGFNEHMAIDGEWYKFAGDAVNIRYFAAESID